MSKRKSFTAGQPVEVQREPSTKWETATYRKMSDGFSSPHHQVDLDVNRYIDSMSGMEVQDPASNPRAYATRFLIVPSRRIRSKVTGS